MPTIEALVRDAQKGEPEAFASIVDRFQDMAVGYTYSRVSDLGLAKEVAQESFLRAFLDLHSLRDSRAFPAWFRRIVLMRCNRVMRRKRLQTVGIEAAERTASPDPSPEEVTDRNCLREGIAEAVGALPEGEATAVTLHYISEHSYREVADFLDIPISTVKSRLHTARKRLRRPLLTLLKDDLGEARSSRDHSFSRRVNELVRQATLVDPEDNTFTLVEGTM